MMKKRTLVLVALFVALGMGVLLPSASLARYPDRPIQLIIAYVPGATGDITARMLAEELEKVLGQKVIPMNKPGASTVLATEYVARGKKDGYTLLYAGFTSTVYVPITKPEVVKYDPAKDLEVLGFHYVFPQCIAVKADAPWKNFGEFIDYAKKNPGKVRVSTIGVASQPHFVLEMVSAITGAKFTHVPFEGGESVVTAVMGGHVEATSDGYAKIRPHEEAGRMKIFLSTNKLPGRPDIPTITELGYKQRLFPSNFCVYAPSGIPEEVRNTLVPALEKAIKATKPKVDQMGSLVEYHSPAETVKIREEEYKQIYDIATKIGLRKK